MSSTPSNSLKGPARFIFPAIFLVLAIVTYPRISIHVVPPVYFLKLIDFLRIFSIMSLGLAGFAFWTRKTPGKMLAENGWANAWLFICLLGLVICTNRIYAMQFKWLRVLVYLAVLLQLLKSYHLLVVKPQAKGWKMRISTILLPVFVLFIFAEIGFMFVARPHGSYPDYLAQINWNLRYWEVNADGYRDEDFSRGKGKRTVMVMGDSFTAGSGIKDPADRFSNLLESRTKAVFWNLGQPGSNTPQMFRRIQEAEDLKPDVLLLSYCLNDIHDAAKQAGVELEWNPAGSGIPGFLMPLMHYSHSVNYFFGIYGMGFTQMDYFSWLEGCFTNPEVLKYHHADLDKIVEHCRQRGIKMAVVVFPLMQAPDRSTRITGIISEYFRSRDVAVADLGPVLADYPAESLWVRPLDPHPNEFVNAVAADELEKMLRDSAWVD
jgi:hypothetical protein